MILLYSIIGGIVLIIALGMLLGPSFASLVAIGILLGCMFRGLYLISKIHTQLFRDEPKKDKVKEAYRRYLEEGK